MMQNIEIVRSLSALPGNGPKVPWRPPAWRLSDSAGKWHRSNDFLGRLTLIVFYRAAPCSHCLQLLKLTSDFSESPEGAGLTVVAISPESRADLARTQQRLGRDRFVLLSDDTAKVFELFSCLDNGEPLHGVFLVSPQGQVVWHRISSEAMSDLTLLKEQVQRQRTPQASPRGR